MSQNELLALRKRIIDDVIPLAIQSTENTADRFELLLRIIQSGNAATAVYERAYDAANAIDDNEEKLNALMSLVEEIDTDLQSEGATVEDQPADSPAPESRHIPVEHDQN